MGPEWPELLGSGRVAGEEHTGYGGVAGISTHGILAARGQGCLEDAPAGRCCACGEDAGDAAAKIIRQRGGAKANTKTLGVAGDHQITRSRAITRFFRALAPAGLLCDRPDCWR